MSIRCCRNFLAGKAGAFPFELKGADAAVVFDGFINVEKEGEYTFYMDAPAGALLRLHQATILDARAGAPSSRGKVLLTAGLHPFRLYYLHDDDKKSSPLLQWQGPGFTREEIPASVFVH